MLYLLDLFFYWFHICIILLNSFGFIFPKTRRLHFWVIHLTLFSWIVLGYNYGWGYCFLTDWHYDILYKLGEAPSPSFIVYLAQRCCGINLGIKTADIAAVFVLIIALIGAYYFKLKPKPEVKIETDF